jgi:4-oxalocrotonate tautomerase
VGATPRWIFLFVQEQGLGSACRFLANEGSHVMPVVTIRIAKGRPVEKKRALAKAVTEVVAENLDVKSKAVIFILDEYDDDDWAVGGLLHSDKVASGAA